MPADDADARLMLDLAKYNRGIALAKLGRTDDAIEVLDELDIPEARATVEELRAGKRGGAFWLDYWLDGDRTRKIIGGTLAVLFVAALAFTVIGAISAKRLDWVDPEVDWPILLAPLLGTGLLLLLPSLTRFKAGEFEVTLNPYEPEDRGPIDLDPAVIGEITGALGRLDPTSRAGVVSNTARAPLAGEPAVPDDYRDKP